MDPAAEAAQRSTPQGAGASRRRERAFRAVLLVLGASAGLTGMELAARLMLTDFYACDPAVGWTFEPGRAGLKLDRRLEYVVRARINSAGFHDVEHALAKPTDTLRVVLLGDSMLAGMQVGLEETFARQLEGRLNETAAPPGTRFEVVNCAMDGFGTTQALLMFEERCRHYRPDLVLLGFFATNDVLDNYWGARSLAHPVARRCGRPYLERRGGALAQVGTLLGADADPETPILDRMLRRSYLYEVVAPPPGFDAEQPRFRLDEVFRREYSAEHEAAWEVTKGLLLALEENVRRGGGELGVLLVPSKHEVYPEHARHAERLDLARPQRILTAFLAEHGLGHLDLTSGLRTAGKNGRTRAALYFERDMHWTGRGNRVAGKLVARWLGERYSRASAAGAAPFARSPSAAPERSSTTGPPREPPA